MNEETNLSFFLHHVIRRAVREDVGHGDITSLETVPAEIDAKAHFIGKEDFILAGMPFVGQVFSVVDPEVRVTPFFGEGSSIKRGDHIAEVSGKGRSVLAGERTALNILQRISGIATLTKAYSARVSDLPVRIADTRKTTPGMRFMEKYGVRVGGGYNHRFGLYDGILIKDNHIKIAGGVREAINCVKRSHHLLKIEVEVKDLDEVKEALRAGADVLLLDNMPVATLNEAVRCAREHGRGIILEASGNMTLETVRAAAETGVDIISVGAITHSARAVDISMKIV